MKRKIMKISAALLLLLILPSHLLGCVSTHNSTGTSGTDASSENAGTKAPETKDNTQASAPESTQKDADTSAGAETQKKPETTNTPADTDKGTDKDTEKYIPSVTRADSPYDFTAPTEQEMAQMYQNALQAEASGQIQYAYGLYSRLGIENYLDSRLRASALRAEANSTKLLTSVYFYVTESGQKYLNAPGEQFIYLDPEGTPTVVILYDDTNTIEVTKPDPELRDVISIHSYYLSNCGNHVIICLKKDGTLHLLYDDELSYWDESYKQSVDGTIADIEKRFESMRDVVGVYDNTVALHKDGTLTRLFSHKWESYNERLDAILADFTDVVDFGRYSSDTSLYAAVRADGTLVGYRINNGMPVPYSYSRGEPN